MAWRWHKHWENTHKSGRNRVVWFVTVFIGDMLDILGSRLLMSFIIVEDQVADDSLKFGKGRLPY